MTPAATGALAHVAAYQELIRSRAQAQSEIKTLRERILLLERDARGKTRTLDKVRLGFLLLGAWVAARYLTARAAFRTPV